MRVTGFDQEDIKVEYEKRPRWAKYLAEEDYELTARGMFTTAAAAAYAGVSEGTIRQAIKQGKLKATRLGRGFRIALRDLKAFLGIEEA